MEFDISIPVLQAQEWLLLKNAPWNKINIRIAAALDSAGGDLRSDTQS
ncbi:hypothetical protein S40285_09758 [Stachybotrys chlorohalonatus IBT 40285]|uniref:Uncharacterized protein n=1 Tax=Stachybotrys chlorohalonatus (strain IBT 40285) TaxID=1283841 RepID=A0A084R270_STAC4|nr:hypothetical protein S40285_09758 [Stachybotrys chlorohalonata IBT 40285]